MPSPSNLKLKPQSSTCPTDNRNQLIADSPPNTSPSPKTHSGQSVELPRQPQLSISPQTFSMFLINAIEKIASERETRKSQNAAVRKACNEALVMLRDYVEKHPRAPTVSSGEPASAHLPPLPSEYGMLLGDEKLLRPFQLACSMKSPRIVITAVDSLQKLIAHGHVPNDAVGSDGTVRLIEQIVTTICSCFQGAHTDDGVQLQVLRALLTVITSPVVEIHETYVLSVVRTCYNIFIATKNLVNQATARATLMQIIGIIFQRMEQNALEAASIVAQQTTPDNVSADVSLEQNGCAESPTPETDSNHATETTTAETTTVKGDDDDEAGAVVRSILDDIIQQSSLSDNEGVAETVPPASPDTSDAQSVHSEVVELPNGVIAEENKDGVDSIAQLEAVAMAHVTQKDAFFVFRSLCLLATKEFTGSRSAEAKSAAVRSKVLSLQLLLSIFQQPGPLFLTSVPFITAIKRHLCVALFRNGVSPVPEVCELSVTIFLSLLTHFKSHLKPQIEVFLKDVFLVLLDSSTFEYKWIVLEALRHICADAQCVVDIYLNYDCDINMTNLFESLITSLAKIAQGSSVTEHGCSYAQRQALRTSGLECLVLILRCMADWSQELYVTPEPQSFFGSELPSGMNDSPDSISNNDQQSLAASSSSSSLSSSAPQKPVDDPGAFESRKAQKEIYVSGIDLFNRGRAADALRLLQQRNLIGSTHEAVAEFLRTEDRLSEAHVGDFLGENDPYNLRVMYAYVDQFDFAGKDFVPSLREFLSGFRLPGEAQKIDRLMEKFAAHYCACNSNMGLFASADTAYVLAFSIIMLTTDLHSTQIKSHQRMTKEDYIRMNRGINDSQDLSESYLARIYDEIARCGIKLRSGDAVSRLSGTAGSTPSGFRSSLSVTSASGQIDDTQSDFTSATHCDHVRPMFKLSWSPLFAAFTVGLNDCDAIEMAHLCLEGIRYAIRIACIFHMEMERNAYVQALARFTLLLTASVSGVMPTTMTGASYLYGSSSSLSSNTSASARRPKSEVLGSVSSSSTNPSTIGTATTLSSPEVMKQKNIDTIRTLITVAQTLGNYLGCAWLEILRCISQLESAHLITQQGAGHMSNGPVTGSGLLTRAATFAVSHHPTLTNGTTPRRSAVPPSSSSIFSSTPSGAGNGTVEPVTHGSLAAASVDPKKAAVLQEVMGETGSHSVIVAVDKIFTGSVRLDGDAIVDFVKALCQVSREELLLPHPRMFSLQKVVEISYYNMGRIRLQWSRVWEHVGGHFIAAAQSANEDVAEFVVDSLRQLSVKLIEKGELPNFNFQKEFLRPFVSILDSGATGISPKIQDMVIRCVSHLVHAQHMNIRSGWTNIFAALHHAASSPNGAIVDMAFETCNFTINQVLTQHLHVALDAFQAFAKLLSEFACNPHFSDMAIESIGLIRVCADLVSQNASIFASSQPFDQNATPLATLPTMDLDQAVSDRHPSPRSTTSDDTVVLTDGDQIWLKGYMPVLCELFRVIYSCKLDVRTRALTMFFDIVKTYGNEFKPLWWRDTFTIIFRVFQHFRTNSGMGESQVLTATNLSLMEQTEWMNTTCNHTLFSIVDVFAQFYEPLNTLLLDDIYTQLRWCCLQEHEQLARSGTTCLETLILSTGKRFSHEIWERTVQLIVDLFEASVPHQLLTWRPDSVWDKEDRQRSPGGSNASPVPRYLAQARLFADLLIKCVVQFELIETVDHILFYPHHSRNEDAHYLTETRALAVASYPAYSAALTVSSKVDIGDSASRNHSVTESQWLDVSSDTDEVTESKPETWWLGPSGTRVTVGARPLPTDPRSMYSNLSPEQRITLVRCLLQSHAFAKQFNSNDEQRSVLFEAGFKVKAKPNLLKQETHSLLCSLRILFKLAEEETEVREEAEELLDRVILDALSYYHGLLIDGHRQAWDSCLILIMNQLTRLAPATRFHRHATRLYAGVCDLVAMAVGVSPEVAALIRLFLLRCGAFFLPPLGRGSIAS